MGHYKFGVFVLINVSGSDLHVERVLGAIDCCRKGRPKTRSTPMRRENAQTVVGALDAKRPFNITRSVNVPTHVPLAPY